MPLASPIYQETARSEAVHIHKRSAFYALARLTRGCT